MGLFALVASTEGMAEETLLYVLLTPVMIAAGYDALTAVAVISVIGIMCWGLR
jgi:uncharacterized ion transporter superfamily protein YfcC